MMEGGLGWPGGPGWLTCGGRVRAALWSAAPPGPSDLPERPELPVAPEPLALPEPPAPAAPPPEPVPFLSLPGLIRSGAIGCGEASVTWRGAAPGAVAALPPPLLPLP
ncbi:MAG TPA: hypothetical protein VMW75_04800, partial [Thermoanaerobaculia bacterium]|nr:hypothetical protein [Thermoanaerobaculia bacterium]